MYSKFPGCPSGDLHALRTKDLGQVDGGMYLELDLTPVLDHRSDVVVIRCFKHHDIRSVAPKSAIKANRFQSNRLPSFIPPLTRFGDDVSLTRQARPALYEC